MTKTPTTLRTADGAAFMQAEVMGWPEKKLQAEIIRTAVGTSKKPSPLGWTHAYHTYFSDRSERGFPDLLLGHFDGRIIVAELKSTKGTLTDAQEGWLAFFRSHQDTLRGVIASALRRPLGPRDEIGRELAERDAARHAKRLFGVYVWRPEHWHNGQIIEALQ